MTNPATTALPLISGTEQHVARLVQLFETLLEIEAMATELGRPEIIDMLFDGEIDGVPTINTTLLDDYAYPEGLTPEEYEAFDATPEISLTSEQLVWYQLRERLATQSVGVYTRGLTGQWPVVMYSMWRQMIAGDKQ